MGVGGCADGSGRVPCRAGGRNPDRRTRPVPPPPPPFHPLSLHTPRHAAGCDLETNCARHPVSACGFPDGGRGPWDPRLGPGWCGRRCVRRRAFPDPAGRGVDRSGRPGRLALAGGHHPPHRARHRRPRGAGWGRVPRPGGLTLAGAPGGRRVPGLRRLPRRPRRCRGDRHPRRDPARAGRRSRDVTAAGAGGRAVRRTAPSQGLVRSGRRVP